MTAPDAVGVFVGLYASSPTFQGEWDPEIEGALFDRLAEVEGVRGLELPWFGDLHQHDPEWLLEALRPDWSVVYTTIQSTARRALHEPHFGLASEDAEGRSAAVDVVRALATAGARLADSLGRTVVEAVEIHSQPRGLGGGRGSCDALARSLEELLDEEWNGAVLVVEHADRAIRGQESPKGYLPLGDEIEAVARFEGAPVGLEINWGRSAIELRDGDRVVEHIAQAREAGVLRSLFLSGVAGVDGAFGAAWDDAHPPFASVPGYHGFEPSSILTAERAAAALSEAGAVDFLGIKFGHRPIDGPLESIITQTKEAVRLVHDLRP